MSTTNTTLTDDIIDKEWQRSVKENSNSDRLGGIVIPFARAIEQLVAQEVRRLALEEAANISEIHFGFEAAKAIRALANADPVHPDQKEKE